MHTIAIHCVVYHWTAAPVGLRRRCGASVGRRQACRNGGLGRREKGGGEGWLAPAYAAR